LVNREEAIKQLSEAVTTHFEGWKRKITDKQNHPIPICAAGPGVGKSRLTQEGLTLLKNSISKDTEIHEYLEDALPILISFGSGYSMRDIESNWSVETVVSFRILWSCYIPSSHTYGTWISSCGVSPNTSLTLDSTLEFIAKNKSKKCIYLGIDEFQEILKQKEQKFRNFISVLSGVLSSNHSLFLIPVLSGLSYQKLTDIIRLSKGYPVPLSTPYLPLQSISTIMDSLSISDREYVNQFFF